MSSGVFAVIVSGRLVQTEFSQVGETQFLATIAEADNINHVVVFLTGATPLPQGTCAMVYFSWPDPNAPPNWQLLGHISNAKPSAIFKISNLKKLSEMQTEGAFSSAFGLQQICHDAQIGISIEPEINAQINVPDTLSTDNYATFGQKMIEHFVNYVASFAITQNEMQPSPGVSFVPLNTLQNWCQNFERRLQQNPNFWKS